jgi:hypothetical protein
MWSLMLDGSSLANSCNVAAIGESLDPPDLSVDLSSATTKNLVVRYFTPQDDVEIPAQISLPYTQPYRFSKDFGPYNVASGREIPSEVGVVSVVGDNIRLNQIPSCVYIFVKTSNSVKNTNAAVLYADVFGKIQGVNIQWGNQTGILSSATKDDLRAIAVENGFDNCDTQEQLDSLVLKLEFGKDVPLENNETPGMRGDYNWQCTISTLLPDVSRNAYAGTFAFEQVFMYEGEVKISPNECIAMTGIVNLDESASAVDMGHEHREGGSAVGGSMVGGSAMGGGLLRKMKKGKHILHQVAKVTGQVDHGIDNVVKTWKSRA